MSDHHDLAARVAHGINNPLTAVIANLETALRELDELGDERAVVYGGIIARLEEARAAAYRVHGIVRALTQGVLPADPMPSQTGDGVAQRHARGASTRRGRVLVVDDELLITNAVRRLLASSHDVTALSSAIDALARMSSGERFDVIVCDLAMPAMSGMELHERLRSLAPDQAAKMIFLTGGAFTADARAFLDQVPNERIEKPFDPRSLKTLVDNRVR